MAWICAVAILIIICTRPFYICGQHCDAENCSEVQTTQEEVSYFGKVWAVARSVAKPFYNTVAKLVDEATKIAYRVWTVLFDEVDGIFRDYVPAILSVVLFFLCLILSYVSWRLRVPFYLILLANCSMYILYIIFGPVLIAGIVLIVVQYMYRFCIAIALSSNLRFISAIVVVGATIWVCYVSYFRGESTPRRQLTALTQQIKGIEETLTQQIKGIEETLTQRIKGIEETQNTLIDNQNRILQKLETMQKDDVSNGTS